MKYQKGDKVVIREDLKVGKKYGNITWLEGMEPMKSMLFTTILGVGDKGSYVLDTGWCISEEMISHKQEEGEEEEEVAEFNTEVKYRAGDKVVLRKDLEINTMYNGASWVENMTKLAELPYVEIVEVDSHNLGKGTIYYIEGSEYVISNDMISHVYTEQEQRVEQTMKYQEGDKVVIRKDLELGKEYGKDGWVEGMKHLVNEPYVTIEHELSEGHYSVVDTVYRITDEMISHKYEKELSVWYCEDDKYAHVLCCDGSIFTINKASDNGDTLNNILERPTDSFLLTLGEAKKSAIYLVLKRVKVNKPKMYYIRMGLGDFKYVNCDVVSGEYFLSTKEETKNERTMFTEEEADKIVGTNSILTKEEVG